VGILQKYLLLKWHDKSSSSLSAPATNLECILCTGMKDAGLRYRGTRFQQASPDALWKGAPHTTRQSVACKFHGVGVNA